MINFIIAYILFRIYAMFEGITHAVMFSEQGERGFNKFIDNSIFKHIKKRTKCLDIHTVFNVIRIVLLVAFYIVVSKEFIIPFISTCLLGFSFYHNGAYGETRRRIDKPEYHWFYHSRYSTSVFNIPGPIRTGMVILDISLTIAYILIKCLL